MAMWGMAMCIAFLFPLGEGVAPEPPEAAAAVTLPRSGFCGVVPSTGICDTGSVTPPPPSTETPLRGLLLPCMSVLLFMTAWTKGLLSSTSSSWNPVMFRAAGSIASMQCGCLQLLVCRVAVFTSRAVRL